MCVCVSCACLCTVCFLWLATRACVGTSLVTFSEYAVVQVHVYCRCMFQARCVCTQVVELFTCMGPSDYEWDALTTIGMVIPEVGDLHVRMGNLLSKLKTLT